MDPTKTRRYRPNRTPLACLLLAGLMLAGCAAPPKAALHTEDTILGRRLYDTAPAYIYASSQAAADQAGSDLLVAMQDYRKATGREPAGKGLLIVTDKKDTPYADLNDVLRMTKRLDDMAKFAGPTTLPADLQETLAEVEQEIGTEVINMMFLAKPATTDMGEATRLWDLTGRPACKADWMLAVPTGELTREAVHLMMQKTLSRKDVPVAARILVAPMLLLVEGQATKAARTDRQVASFLMFACTDTGLDVAVRKATFQKYQKAKDQEAMQDMPTFGGSKMGPAKTQPTTRPAAADLPATTEPAAENGQ